ncbi:hypothetical protein CVD28_03465 [Bacillus sp. M6-12]|uniref:hypothetical protein n=1 Tax=Bacillus sp. M6-12 TaxID=2054166 RepID=UPI000C760519|nr:hypothetical protein [Bacillus sp. M6-12]PLS19488.1 hypothetical protein CVD28_03465 [Bacillus sp. M6-12]
MLDKNKTYKDEEGNDVILIASFSKEEIEKQNGKHRERIKKSIESAQRVLDTLNQIEIERQRHWLEEENKYRNRKNERNDG